jgi:hypothetical protein
MAEKTQRAELNYVIAGAIVLLGPNDVSASALCASPS